MEDVQQREIAGLVNHVMEIIRFFARRRRPASKCSGELRGDFFFHVVCWEEPQLVCMQYLLGFPCMWGRFRRGVRAGRRKEATRTFLWRLSGGLVGCSYVVCVLPALRSPERVFCF